MSISREDFQRCNFCTRYLKNMNSCSIGGIHGTCDPYEYRDYEEFKLNPEVIIKKAKELGISVQDVLALIEQCN